MVMKYEYNGGLRGANYSRGGSGIVNIDRKYVDETALFAFTSHTFTNAGATGARGPTLANTSSAYAGAAFLGGFFNTIAGIQYFTIPSSGTYTISVAGAKGGNNTTWSIAGANGAFVQATFTLLAGDELKMIVGQMSPNAFYLCGGGGGTFVCYSNNSPIIIAGGGAGGTYFSTSYLSSQAMGRIADVVAGANTVGGRGNGGTSLNGNTPNGATNGSGGLSGLGLAGANNYSVGTYSSGAGGGGLLTNGGYNANSVTASGNYAEIANGGIAFVNGGNGGEKTGESYAGDGGFGGGGSAEYWQYVGGGGGGGYSGGHGGTNWGSGGGGSSYVAAGGSTIITAQNNASHGYITITKL